MATPREQKFDGVLIPAAEKINRYFDRPVANVAALAAKNTWETPVKRGGHNVSALQELADSKTLGQQNRELLVALNAKVDGLVGALSKVAGGATFDQGKLLADMEAATARGIAAAIDNVTRQEVTVVSLRELEDLGEIPESGAEK